ncbi:MAG: helix-turn-helix transcriptional regulator [Candidatus Obscuribacterales bacterium]|nr:helix-turn-helix transcriptional regulator [Candidatus Obscuribacterales bacterium]
MLQTIKSVDGRPEYVLLPMAVYKALHESIEREVMKLESQSKDDYVAFDPAEYIENPIALARLQSHVRQIELAELLGVSQAYISKVENQEIVSPKLLARVRSVLERRSRAKY